MKILIAAILFPFLVMAQNPNVPLAQNAFGTVAYIQNASSTGTVLNKLASLTGAPSKAVIATAGATSGVVGIVTSGTGTTGTATVQVTGSSVPCVFDGSTTAGNYVQISASVDGDCTDAGSTLPTSGPVYGRVLTTNSGVGTYKIDLQPSSGTPSSGPGSGTVTLATITAGSGISTSGTCTSTTVVNCTVSAPAVPSTNPAPPVVTANGTAAISANSSANNYGGILTFGTVTGSSTTTITATWQTQWPVKPICAVFGANSSSGDLAYNFQPFYDYANSTTTTALFKTSISNWTTGMAISYKCRQPTSAAPAVSINSGAVTINSVSDQYQGIFTFGAVTGASTTVTLTAPSAYNAKPSCQFFGLDSTAAGFLWTNGNYFDYTNSSTALVKWHSGSGGFSSLSNTSYAYFCEDGAEFLPVLSGAGAGAAITAGANMSHGIITTGAGVGASDVVLTFAALGSGTPACQFDAVGSEPSADNWHNTAGFFASGSSTPVSIHLSVPFASSGVGISYSCTVSAGQNGPGSVGSVGAIQIAGTTAGSLAAQSVGTGGGTAQVQTATFSPARTSLFAGLTVYYLPSIANSAAAPTFSPDGLTAHPVVKAGGALAQNDLITTAIAILVYDATGTHWELQNPQTLTPVGPSGTYQLQLTPTQAQIVWSAGSVAANVCSYLNIFLTGASAGHSVAVGVPYDMPDNLIVTAKILAPDSVRIGVCNPTVGAITSSPVGLFRVSLFI